MAAVPSIGRASLVEAPARSAQAAATEGLYARHSAKILGYCMHQLGSREEAEDAVQTTFMNAFRALGRGVVPESESAWLFKIAENVCLSRRRSSWRRGRIESPSDFDVIEEIVPGPSRQRDELIGIEDALASMPDQQRRAILLREWQGLSYREISEELEVSQSAVETLIFRARRSLAHGLEQPEQQRKPKRKGLRRALHILDLGTVLAAAKTLFAGSAAVQATAAAVAVTAVAGTAATVKNEGHSPKPAEAKPAAIAPAPKAAPKQTPAPVSSAPIVEHTEVAAAHAPSPTGVAPRSRPAAVATPSKAPARHSAPKPAASVPVSAVPASAPTAAVVPPAQPEAPAAPPPAPIAQPEPTQPPGVVAPPSPVDAKPTPRAYERKTAEQRRQERQERREERRNQDRPATSEPLRAPSAIVANVPTPGPAAPDVVPAEPEQAQGERRRGRRWQQRELASLPVDPAPEVVEETTGETPAADPAAAPAAEPAEEPERRPRRGRRG